MSNRLRTLVPAVALILAAASPALAAEKVVEIGKAFPFLKGYLELPPAERSHFTMAYYLKLGSAPLTAPVWIVEGDRRTPLQLGPMGKVPRLPSLAQLAEAKIAIGVDPATKINTVLGVEPITPPAADLDARELAAAIAQAAVGEKKAAGIMAMAMPKLSNVGFVGVPSGEVEFADGHRAPLPTVKGLLTYDPAAQPNARRIRLPKTPDKLDIN
ncbi:MAG: hypothetical protein ACXWKR_02170 [Phenylobacterium sp.]